MSPKPVKTSIVILSEAFFSGAKDLLLGILLVSFFALTGCRPHDFPQYPANYREYAYVTNGGSNTVSVYDVVNMRLDRELQVGQSPSGVTANPKRNEVYVVNSGSAQGNGSVSVIDSEKNSVVATIPLHKQKKKARHNAGPSFC